MGLVKRLLRCAVTGLAALKRLFLEEVVEAGLAEARELVLTLLELAVFLLLLSADRLRLSLRSREAAEVLGGSVVVSAGLTRKSLNRVLLRVVVVDVVSSCAGLLLNLENDLDLDLDLAELGKSSGTSDGACLRDCLELLTFPATTKTSICIISTTASH